MEKDNSDEEKEAKEKFGIGFKIKESNRLLRG